MSLWFTGHPKSLTADPYSARVVLQETEDAKLDTRTKNLSLNERNLDCDTSHGLTWRLKRSALGVVIKMSPVDDEKSQGV